MMLVGLLTIVLGEVLLIQRAWRRYKLRDKRRWRIATLGVAVNARVITLEPVGTSVLSKAFIIYREVEGTLRLEVLSVTLVKLPAHSSSVETEYSLFFFPSRCLCCDPVSEGAGAKRPCWRNFGIIEIRTR